MKRPKQSESDEDWLKALVADPNLQGINVRAEIAACGRWYRENVSKTGAPTRRRIVNWLNKAERVVDLKAMGAQHATGLKVPPPAGPENWRDWLRVQLDCISPETDGFSQLKAAFLNSNFNLMPGSWQARCRAQVIRPPAA